MTDLVVRPSWRLMVRHPAYLIAFGFGAGLAPVAPGTFGTLLALPLYWYGAPQFAPEAFLALVAVLFVGGVWACARTGRSLGVADHPAMVWDETVAFLVVLFFTPAGVLWQAGAFLLFRFFDILKPPPIRHFDRTLKNGFGVMFDDMLAASYTVLVLAVVKTLID